MVEATTLAVYIGGGLFVGLLIGRALRVATRWLLMLIGFLLIPLYLLYVAGIVYVDWGAVGHWIWSIINWLHSVMVTQAESGNVAVVASTTALAMGVFLGYMGLFKDTIQPVSSRLRHVKTGDEKGYAVIHVATVPGDWLGETLYRQYLSYTSSWHNSERED